MERQIYQVSDGRKMNLEFYCCKTNDVEPYKKTRELGIVVLGKDNGDNLVQIDFGFDGKDFDSLIDYLERLRDYCKEFNKNSETLKAHNEK